MIDSSAIEAFSPISLREMDEVKLMNRTDTKFMMSYQEVNKVLHAISDDYRILEIDTKRLSSYRSLYFDTEHLKFYFDHHNGRLSRYKVRIRKYVESELYFLEVKHKYKGRTDKKRIKLLGFEDELKGANRDFVTCVCGDIPELEPTLWNSFQRITLVNKKDAERLTIDLNLTFDWQEWSLTEKNLVIAEVKQEQVDRSSPFMKAARDAGVRPMRMSKYCIGLVRKKPDLKYNQFKPKLLKIHKLEHGVS